MCDPEHLPFIFSNESISQFFARFYIINVLSHAALIFNVITFFTAAYCNHRGPYPRKGYANLKRYFHLKL